MGNIGRIFNLPAARAATCPEDVMLSDDLKERVDVCATYAVDSLTVALDALLPEHFPEAETGDESPDMVAQLNVAIRDYITAWVEANVS